MTRWEYEIFLGQRSNTLDVNGDMLQTICWLLSMKALKCRRWVTRSVGYESLRRLEFLAYFQSILVRSSANWRTGGVCSG